MGTPLRYSIPMPERTRTIWVSAEAEALWKPRLSRISAAWGAVERASVGKLRVAARQSVSASEMAALSTKAVEQGKGLLVLGQQTAGAFYQSRSASLVFGQPWNYNVVLAQDLATAKAFVSAFRSNDDSIIGDLLGYPPCCIQFFQQVWKAENWMDTTWPMIRHLGQNHIRLEGIPFVNNILLRWLGVRLVPHLPCSFDCEGTRAFGLHLAQMMNEAYPEEYAWASALLSARVEWNAIMGIAEIRLPILKISTTTDPLTQPVSVQILGTGLEAESRGNVFPWTAAKIEPSIKPMIFHRDEQLWTDNGFTSKQAMVAAHDKIVEYCRQNRLHGSILDLGCGNGLLASRLSKEAYGVEMDPQRAERARTRLVDVFTGTIDNFKKIDNRHYDVALISENRLIESNNRAELLHWLGDRAETTVIYSYETETIQLMSQHYV